MITKVDAISGVFSPNDVTLGNAGAERKRYEEQKLRGKLSGLKVNLPKADALLVQAVQEIAKIAPLIEGERSSSMRGVVEKNLRNVKQVKRKRT